MIGLKTIRRFRCPFAACVILSIALVLGCDFLCDLGVVSFQLPRPSLVSESTGHHHKDQNHSSSHHHGSKDSHPSHDHGTAKHHHESTNEDEGCCDGLTRQFYSSLVSTTGALVSIVHKEAYKLISTLMFVDMNEISLTGNLPFTFIFEHPPEHAGRAMRVLFCSFLI
jgi:hypothetical protein